MSPSQSPERDALAATIARRDAIQAEIDAIDAALEKIHVVAVDERLRAAKRELADAEAAEPRRLVDELLGRPTWGSPTDLRAQVDAIRAESERLVTTRNILWAERRSAEQRLEWAEQHRRTAIEAVVHGSIGIDRLLNEFREARARVDQLECLFADTLSGCMPPDWGRWDRAAARSAPETLAVAAPWAAALAALETDPDARLPGDPDDEPAMAAAA